MWHSLLITATYAIIAVPLQIGLGLFIAYLLFQKIRGLAIYRMIYFLPYITTTVASAAIWVYLYSPDNGLLNAFITKLGLPPLQWLGESRGIFEMMATSIGITLPAWAGGPNLALIAILLYTTWVFVGYDVVIFLGGMGNISGEYYDAAKVDGAHGWKLFRYITFPLLSPTTFFLLIITVIGTFKAFNHIWIMTQGGPSDATTTASIFIFKQLVLFNRYGYSSALSFIVFIVILILTIIQNAVAGKRVVYD
jgi:multiple sugar transport system permease protein